MKRSIAIVVLICAGLSVCAHSSKCQTLPIRSAKAIPNFIVTALSGVDRGNSWENLTPYGTLDSIHWRYIYNPADTDLGLNCTNSGAMIDWYGIVPPDSVMLKGKLPLPYLVMGSYRLTWAFENSAYLRYELERQPNSRSHSQQYPSFRWRSGLTGVDTSDLAGTFPNYLRSGPDAADSQKNVIRLRAGIDPPGIFDDSAFSATFDDDTTRDEVYHFASSSGKDNKRLLRFRIRVDTPGLDTALHTPLFVVRVEQDSMPSRRGRKLLLNDTIRIDSHFKHYGSGGFDTVSVRFLSQLKADSTFFQLRWLGTVSMTGDYMEIMTAKLDSSKDFHYDSTRGWNVANDSISLIGYTPGYRGGANNEWLALESYEGATEQSDRRLKDFADSLIAHYSGHANFFGGPEEPPIGKMLLMKRFAKLLRQRSSGNLEFLTIMHDSSEQNLAGDGGFYRRGLPNMVQYYLEGVRLGWLPDSLYADPKFFIIEPYLWDYQVALPKRIAGDSSTISAWEYHYALTYVDTATGIAYDNPYQQDNYRQQAQNKIASFVGAVRRANRSCLRNQASGFDQKFLLAWQTGMTPVKLGAPSHPKEFLMANLRAPTEPELRVTANLAASGGAVGLLMYGYTSSTPNGNLGYNGGVMDHFGKHSTNFLSDSLLNFDGHTKRWDSSWVGWANGYAAVKALVPKIRLYGDTLVHSQYFTDVLASESFSSTSIPFLSGSIHTYTDAGLQDALSLIDTSNRTYVHVSVWLDTAHGQHDTLLYITNLRTDDSYDTSGKPSTIDRRLITLKLKRPHLVRDVQDSTGALDPGRVWTPYVGGAAGDSLKVYLLAGDGILVRLMDTIPTLPMQAMAAPRIDYPKKNQTDHFYDHGRIVFDQPVPGVRNPSSGVNKDWSIPSTSRAYSVGIPNGNVVVMRQDSLLYQHPVPTANRTENFRNQNWTTSGSGTTVTSFNFKDSLPTTVSTQPRPRTLSIDSIAHFVTIVTDLEGQGSLGKVKLHDPWFVDGTTYRNLSTTSDTLFLNAPFMPGFGPLNGADQQHYGGIFFKQNSSLHRDTLTPMYGISAYQTVTSDSHNSHDTLPRWTDYSFIEWAKTDVISGIDPEDWTNGVMMQKNNPVVFRQDSAVYTARYKAHMLAFGSPSLLDSGFLYNNQRKCWFSRMDSLGRAHYQVVYTSNGRIVTAEGFRYNNILGMTYLPDQLVTDWNDTLNEYPAEGIHTPYLEPPFFDYVYQHVGADSVEIRLAKLDPFGRPVTYSGLFSQGSILATPVIGTADQVFSPVDIVAWSSGGGIHLKAAQLPPIGGVDPPVTSNELIFHLGDTTAFFPTIWVDTLYHDHDTVKNKFWLAWQRDTIVALVPVHHTYAVQYEMIVSLHPHTLTIQPVLGEPTSPTDITFPIKTGAHPCISGCRIDDTTTVVRVAYEATGAPYMPGQGINVVHWRSRFGWGHTCFFLAVPTDPYTAPSIEVTHYHDSSVAVAKDNYYSLSHERNGGSIIQNWAYDSTTSRYLPAGTMQYGATSPQVSVIRPSHDSLVLRMNMLILPRFGRQPYPCLVVVACCRSHSIGV